MISEIANNTFNMGQNKFATQFTQSQKNVTNYLQRMCDKGYLVAQTVQTREAQPIKLPAPVDVNSPIAVNGEIIPN